MELASEPVSCTGATTKGSGVIQINGDVQIYYERAGGRAVRHPDFWCGLHYRLIAAQFHLSPLLANNVFCASEIRRG